jgi:hypothetical protein
MTKQPNPELLAAIRLLQDTCYNAAKDAGWHNDLATGEPRSFAQNDAMFPQRIALIHSEASEALEGHRKGIRDDKLPHRMMAEVELGDLIIRACDLAGAMGYDLAGAIVEKLAVNAARADHKPENRRRAGGKAY